MAIVPLSGVLRDRAGKGPARSARRAGDIPGVLYGHGQAATPLTVNQKEFINAIRHVEGGNMIVSLKLGNGEKTALVREVQLDPISHDIIHLDFQEVSLSGARGCAPCTSPASRRASRTAAAFSRPSRARSSRVPGHFDSSFLEADVSALEVGDSLHASDLGLPEGVVLLTEGDQTIATCVPPTVYEAPVAAEVAPTAAEPELVAAKGKEDKEEGEEKPEKGEKGEKGEKEKK